VAWGLFLIAVAVVIGWRRARIDGFAVAVMLIAAAGTLAFTYRSLGG